MLQAVHDTAEAERVENTKLHKQLSAVAVKTMEETIKQMEAEKAALEVQNVALQVTTDAAKAEAAKAAAEAAAAAAGSNSSSTLLAGALADAITKKAATEMAKECMYICTASPTLCGWYST